MRVILHIVGNCIDAYVQHYSTCIHNHSQQSLKSDFACTDLYDNGYLLYLIQFEDEDDASRSGMT